MKDLVNFSIFIITEVLKNCSSMKDIRMAMEKKPEIKDAWLESTKGVFEIVSQRFSRLKLKDEPVSTSISDSARDQLNSIKCKHK